MNTEKRIRNEAKTLISKGNWSSALGVFFILFSTVLLAIFIQNFIVLGVRVILTPIINIIAEAEPSFSLEVEDSLGNSVITIIASTLGYIAYALGFLLIFPVYCGVKRYFYHLTTDEDATISDVFYYLTVKLKSCLLFGLRYGIICVLKFLPCIAPAYMIFLAIYYFEFSTGVISLLTLCIFITGIAGLAIWILWTSRQSLAIYLFIKDDTQAAGYYVKESERITAGMLNKSVRKLIFSFSGWFLLALTGVGMLYFVPYFETSMATSAKWIIKLQKEVC